MDPLVILERLKVRAKQPMNYDIDISTDDDVYNMTGFDEIPMAKELFRKHEQVSGIKEKITTGRENEKSIQRKDFVKTDIRRKSLLQRVVKAGERFPRFSSTPTTSNKNYIIAPQLSPIEKREGTEISYIAKDKEAFYEEGPQTSKLVESEKLNACQKKGRKSKLEQLQKSQLIKDTGDTKGGDEKLDESHNTRRTRLKSREHSETQEKHEEKCDKNLEKIQVDDRSKPTEKTVNIDNSKSKLKEQNESQKNIKGLPKSKECVLKLSRISQEEVQLAKPHFNKTGNDTESANNEKKELQNPVDRLQKSMLEESIKLEKNSNLDNTGSGNAGMKTRQLFLKPLNESQLLNRTKSKLEASLKSNSKLETNNNEKRVLRTSKLAERVTESVNADEHGKEFKESEKCDENPNVVSDLQKTTLDQTKSDGNVSQLGKSLKADTEVSILNGDKTKATQEKSQFHRSQKNELKTEIFENSENMTPDCNSEIKLDEDFQTPVIKTNGRRLKKNSALLNSLSEANNSKVKRRSKRKKINIVQNITITKGNDSPGYLESDKQEIESTKTVVEHSIQTTPTNASTNQVKMTVECGTQMTPTEVAQMIRNDVDEKQESKKVKTPVVKSLSNNSAIDESKGIQTKPINKNQKSMSTNTTLPKDKQLNVSEYHKSFITDEIDQTTSNNFIPNAQKMITSNNSLIETKEIPMKTNDEQKELFEKQSSTSTNTSPILNKQNKISDDCNIQTPNDVLTEYGVKTTPNDGFVECGAQTTMNNSVNDKSMKLLPKLQNSKFGREEFLDKRRTISTNTSLVFDKMQHIRRSKAFDENNEAEGVKKILINKQVTVSTNTSPGLEMITGLIQKQNEKRSTLKCEQVQTSSYGMSPMIKDSIPADCPTEEDPKLDDFENPTISIMDVPSTKSKTVKTSGKMIKNDGDSMLTRSRVERVNSSVSNTTQNIKDVTSAQKEEFVKSQLHENPTLAIADVSTTKNKTVKTSGKMNKNDGDSMLTRSRVERVNSLVSNTTQNIKDVTSTQKEEFVKPQLDDENPTLAIPDVSTTKSKTLKTPGKMNKNDGESMVTNSYVEKVNSSVSNTTQNLEDVTSTQKEEFVKPQAVKKNGRKRKQNNNESSSTLNEPNLTRSKDTSRRRNASMSNNNRRIGNSDLMNYFTAPTYIAGTSRYNRIRKPTKPISELKCIPEQMEDDETTSNNKKKARRKQASKTKRNDILDEVVLSQGNEIHPDEPKKKMSETTAKNGDDNNIVSSIANKGKNTKNKNKENQSTRKAVPKEDIIEPISQELEADNPSSIPFKAKPVDDGINDEDLINHNVEDLQYYEEPAAEMQKEEPDKISKGNSKRRTRNTSKTNEKSTAHTSNNNENIDNTSNKNKEIFESKEVANELTLTSPYVENLQQTGSGKKRKNDQDQIISNCSNKISTEDEPHGVGKRSKLAEIPTIEYKTAEETGSVGGDLNRNESNQLCNVCSKRFTSSKNIIDCCQKNSVNSNKFTCRIGGEVHTIVWGPDPESWSSFRLSESVNVINKNQTKKQLTGIMEIDAGASLSWCKCPSHEVSFLVCTSCAHVQNCSLYQIINKFERFTIPKGFPFNITNVSKTEKLVLEFLKYEDSRL